VYIDRTNQILLQAGYFWAVRDTGGGVYTARYICSRFGPSDGSDPTLLIVSKHYKTRGGAKREAARLNKC